MSVAEQKIRVLIVEDSVVVRELLVRILESDPAICVAGCARDGAEAVAKLAETKPDVVTMDIHMPRMDGIEATRKIMETHPVPIIIVSASCDPNDVTQSFRALEAGAVALIEKPPGVGAPGHGDAARKLVETVKAMAEVRVVKRWTRERMAARPAPARRVEAVDIELVAIGASTGGPPALHTILAALPKPFPVPIVIVSASCDPDDVTQSFRALDAGAVALLEKPPGPGAPGHEAAARKLIEMVKAMSQVRVLKRWPRARMAARPAPARHVEPAADIELVAIGASTGGPPVLQTILTALPKPFPVPIVIVQHIAGGFVQGLADWLAQTTGMTVRLASEGELARPGHVYLASDGCHMRFVKRGRISCADDEPENGLRPAVSCLFRSLAEVYGKRAVGVLLTGMGRDGAAELKLMRDAGAVTIAQDKASAVVNGMPGAAVELDAAAHVCAPAEIAALLRELTMKPRPIA